MSQLVAGTIMLNGSSGEKKFLVLSENNEYQFVTTTNSKDFTSLACILTKLKEEVFHEISSLELIELTYIRDAAQKMPLYVFGLEEILAPSLSKTSYAWETPETLRNLLKKYQVSGIPIFE